MAFLNAVLKAPDNELVDIDLINTELIWSKMYTGQIKSGYIYNKLKKCITINIVDFVCLPIEKLHTCFHLTEDETGNRLTDVFRSK